jgi:hypothetical protein
VDTQTATMPSGLDMKRIRRIGLFFALLVGLGGFLV